MNYSGAAALPVEEPIGSTPDGFRYPLANSIGSQLRQTHRHFERQLQSDLAEHDIPLAMWWFLRALWEHDGRSQRDLSDRAGSTAPAAVEQLRAMEKRGYIERRRDEVDKRKVFVFLTDKGQELRRLLPYAAKVNAIALEGLTDAEIGVLRLILARMQDNFKRHASNSLADTRRRRSPRFRHGAAST